MTSSRWFAVVASASVLAVGVAACGSGGGSGGGLSGTIRIDGSSTVAPLSELVAELFQEENPDVKVTVGTSGTGGGFEKFCAGETDISDASRSIEPGEEEACADNGITTSRLTVANDALTVVVNPENPVSCMTVDQLNQVWDPQLKLGSWSEIKGLEPSFDAELTLFGPGTDSGTFDYFTGAVNGEEGAQRSDYNNVGEDDNQTVTGVQGADGGMGYFGFSYFEENEGKVKALEIDGGEGCVAPSAETVRDGSYVPLRRGLFIYPSAEALRRPEVQEFLQFYLYRVNDVAAQAGFIALTGKQLREAQSELKTLLGSGGEGTAG
ncbi:MAG: PstS family phosphate ABC transporter substrate-binding protein [Solirubrobacterales bacterium]|nr:PstS family phosphate ABC transporter substrate-binding protein [Solirubrobacterales bacterium]